MPDTFIDKNSLATLSGCIGIVFAVCNTLQHVFGFNPRWFALFLSIALCVFGVAISDVKELVDYFFAILNGVIVYASAAGITQSGHQLLIKSNEKEEYDKSPEKSGSRGKSRGDSSTGAPQNNRAKSSYDHGQKRRFLSPWF